MNKRFFASTLLLVALVACGGGSSNSGGSNPPPPPPTPSTPAITAPATAVKGQSYQASTPDQSGCTFTWGATNGTITNGQGTANVTFTADVSGTLSLTCQAKNSANVASATANATITVTDPPPPPPTVYPGIFRQLKSASPSQFRFQASYISGSLNMSSPRAFHTSTQMLDGRIVILGGTSKTGYATTIDIFDPVAERFTTATTTLPQGRTNHAAVLLDNNTVAIMGGGVGTIEVYDPTLDTLTTVMPFDAQRKQSQAINIGGNRILVFGGYDAAGYFNPVIIDTVAWTQRTISTDINLHRIDFAILTLKNGKVLISGGSGDAVMDPKGMPAVRNDLLVFDPSNETFSTIGSMTTPRGRHTMVELPSGQIGIYGGGDGVALTKSTETLDPSTNLTVQGGDLIAAKGYMNSVYLQNGYTLHAGGADSLGYVVNTQMIYDPASKASGYTNSMLSSRKDFTLTLMPNGCYLVTGGQNTNDGVLDNAEVFDPQASVNITYPYAALPTSESVQLTASGDIDGLVWTCDIGSVDQTGKYTAPDMPTTASVAYVTATNSKGKSAIVHVAFLKDVVTIMAPETVKAGTTTTLTANVTWFSDKTVTWSSNIGTIDATGALNVTGVGNGETVYVTAKSNANDKIYDIVKIVVVP